ncbi:YhgE/Pip domain-containing protein [Ornithinibacillus bavariensis]|uniref:Phage infection protein n=1 Tax=Ornithinibacillus bavariensis TaxID=545502 RepID=A0A919X789_9BACI|nr:YhgE/Pip domain-containing protein [Ornithinibacillus bavariensis]GIO25505.1 phage infection protein [Ornithinibacillus bavariensis]HAM80609.1 YhgE/Pip domain-containing protein [Ornithinibacillus sp.]
MKNSIQIFIHDIKNIITNWVAIIIIGGLILLPSLYAWLNINASWDPYGQTEQIPIGVVNEDEGATVRDEKINVGRDLVAELKKNKTLGWQFVNRSKAMDRLEYGEYYAVIVIPKNFSEKLGTVMSNKPEKAQVEYYVNEKINAIAPKITDKGASVIVDQITRKFVSTVNGIIFDIFNKIGIEIGEKRPDIERFENYIFTLQDRLPEINNILNETSEDANHADNMLKRAKGLIPEVKNATANGIEIIDQTTSFLNEAESRLNKISPKVDEDLNKIQTMTKRVNDFINSINSADVDITEGNPVGSNVTGQINDALQSITVIENALHQLQETQEGNDETINRALSEVQAIRQSLEKLSDQVNSVNSYLEAKQAEVDQLFSSIKDRSAKVNERVNAFVKEYKETIEPTVRNEVAKAKDTLTSARGILADVQSAIPEVQGILNRTSDNLSSGKKMLKNVMGEFPYVNEKVNQLANRIRDIQGEMSLGELINILRHDPIAEKGFFEEPVVLNENKVFPIPNYGTGMTPFYTVLAIWVGGLLLISLLSTDVHRSELSYTEKQVYVGRMLTFLTIGLFQTLIVTLGDMFILNVRIAEPFWFVLFGLLCSLIFVMIVYTLVSVFGDVGKALAIVLLVLQIAGAGGTYPVVLLPKFFQVINPFLPFTYAISLMREAVGGIIWEKVLHDVLLLVVFGLLALILGGLLKGPIDKYTSKVKEKGKESGLFH